MLIDKAEIERVKRGNDLAALVRGRGVKLTRRGRQLVGLCPFHEDHEPSFIVDPKKQLWNCLGACNEGGDVYRFVMKADGVDFREAHQRLGGSEPEAKPVSADDLHWLERAVEHYHKRLLETPAAQEYLRSRGIAAPEIIGAFRLGYSDGDAYGEAAAGRHGGAEANRSADRVGPRTDGWLRGFSFSRCCYGPSCFDLRKALRAAAASLLARRAAGSVQPSRRAQH